MGPENNISAQHSLVYYQDRSRLDSHITHRTFQVDLNVIRDLSAWEALGSDCLVYSIIIAKTKPLADVHLILLHQNIRQNSGLQCNFTVLVMCILFQRVHVPESLLDYILCLDIQTWTKLLVLLANMSKEDCKNKSAFFLV